MPIANTDIKYYLSGGASNNLPASSLGGARSTTTEMASDLFDDVNSTEASSGETEYRCIYVYNGHGSLTMENTKIWIQVNTPSPDTVVNIGLGTSVINGTEQGPVADENTAPSGVTWPGTPPSSEGTALTIGNIPFGQHKAVWVRRVVSQNAAAWNSDGFTLRVKCDTAA